jgi:hypothetical protein
MKNFKLFGQFLAFVIGLLFFAACQQEEIANPNAIQERGGTGAVSNTTVASYPAIDFWGVSPSNDLMKYRSTTPPTLVSSTKISGLQPEEHIMAVDIRTIDKSLYAVTDMGALYVIDATGASKLISQTPFDPAISGDAIGFDYNQLTDRFTIISSTGQNYKIDPNSGQVVAIDMPVKLGMAGSAYNNGILYDIDATQGVLYKQDPMTSYLTQVGPTNIHLKGDGGFDISSGGWGLAVYLSSNYGADSATVPTGTSREAWLLYNVNLKTGQTVTVGEVLPMVGIAATQ